MLDAAHALMAQGVHRYPRRKAAILREEEERARDGARSTRADPTTSCGAPCRSGAASAKRPISDASAGSCSGLPEENILYFLEKRRRC